MGKSIIQLQREEYQLKEDMKTDFFFAEWAKGSKERRRYECVLIGWDENARLLKVMKEGVLDGVMLWIPKKMHDHVYENVYEIEDRVFDERKLS